MKPRSEKRLKSVVSLVCVFAFAGSAISSVNSPERVLTDAEWRADIEAAAAAIHEFHPGPFRDTTADSFQEHYDALLADVPGLCDKEVVVRLIKPQAR